MHPAASHGSDVPWGWDPGLRDSPGTDHLDY